MTDRERTGRDAVATGKGNQSIALGILLRKQFNASEVELPHSPYDLIIQHEEPRQTIRTQVKTVLQAIM